MNLDDTRDALNAAGLADLADKAEQLTLPAIRITAEKAEEADIPIGASKIGGQPDLPADVPWPEHNGQPLGFLAQFNLTEIASYDDRHVLPPTGLLSFFYDFAAASWGLRPEDRGGWQVLYFAGSDASLSRGAWPANLPMLHRLPAQRPTFSSETSLTSEPEWIANMTLTDNELLKVASVAEELAGPAEENEDSDDDDDNYVMLATAHQLLGYPLLARAGTPLECELVSTGQPNTAADVITHARKHGDDRARQQLLDAFERWRLLFQLGNISGLSFPEGGEDDDDPVWRLSELCDLWARGGLMHFLIERDRLARADFSNVWLLADSQL